MVESVACYDVIEPKELSSIEKSLSDYEPQIEGAIRVGENEVDIGTWILGIGSAANKVFGTMEKTEVKEQTVGDAQFSIPIQHSGDFIFLETSPLRLAVFSGRDTADTIALKLGNIIYRKRDKILKKRISGSDIEKIYRSMIGGKIKVAAFKNLIIPGLAKARISGPDVGSSGDYARYKKLGELSYLMFVSAKYGNLTMSVNEDCQVIFYGQVDHKFVENVLKQDIFPFDCL
jgi:hypothetical protein